jgi:hypothetical protein
MIVIMKSTIGLMEGEHDAFITRRSKRFGWERLAGLFSRHAGQGRRKLTPRLEARILDWTLKRKPSDDGSTHWSTRKLGSALSISQMMVARVWAKHALKSRNCLAAQGGPGCYGVGGVAR